MQLFLLHFAGGSCYSFEFLKDFIDKRFEVYALELPGRGKRNEEEFLLEKRLAIEDYFIQIKSLRNAKPYLIYGHSMGATLGLSVSRRMEDVGDGAQTLVVSGNSGPGNKTNTKKRFELSDLEFKEELRRLGGVPEEFLNNDELYEFFGPIMRSDFELLEKDSFLEEGIKIKAPIYAIMGNREEEVKKIENWKKFTSNRFDSKILSGGHFFIHSYPAELAKILLYCSNNWQSSIAPD